MTGIIKSINTYFKHTKRYYAPILGNRSVAQLAMMAMAIVFLGVAVNVSVAHAGIEEWIIDDVLNEDIFNGKYDYMLTADAPPESENRFHLQMPMMLEGFLPASNYVSGGAGDPADQKLDDVLKLTILPSFFNANDFVLPTAEECEATAPDVTEFIEDRPPQSGLK